MSLNVSRQRVGRCMLLLAPALLLGAVFFTGDVSAGRLADMSARSAWSGRCASCSLERS